MSLVPATVGLLCLTYHWTHFSALCMAAARAFNILDVVIAIAEQWLDIQGSAVVFDYPDFGVWGSSAHSSPYQGSDQFSSLQRVNRVCRAACQTLVLRHVTLGRMDAEGCLHMLRWFKRASEQGTHLARQIRILDATQIPCRASTFEALLQVATGVETLMLAGSYQMRLRTETLGTYSRLSTLSLRECRVGPDLMAAMPPTLHTMKLQKVSGLCFPARSLSTSLKRLSIIDCPFLRPPSWPSNLYDAGWFTQLIDLRVGSRGGGYGDDPIKMLFPFLGGLDTLYYATRGSSEPQRPWLGELHGLETLYIDLTQSPDLIEIRFPPNIKHLQVMGHKEGRNFWSFLKALQDPLFLPSLAAFPKIIHPSSDWFSEAGDLKAAQSDWRFGFAIQAFRALCWATRDCLRRRGLPEPTPLEDKWKFWELVADEPEMLADRGYGPHLMDPAGPDLSRIHQDLIIQGPNVPQGWDDTWDGGGVGGGGGGWGAGGGAVWGGEMWEEHGETW